MFANKFGRYGNCECGLVVVIKGKENAESFAPVPLTSSKVNFTTFDTFAEVTVTQVYCNQETSPIEAEYLFPLDDKAAVFEFEAEIETRRVIGKVKEKEQAKQEYEEAIRHGQTAAMLEKKRPDIFKASVGCLKPGAKATIKISYISELSVDEDNLRFVIPTTVAPRYVPQKDKEEETGKELAAMPYSSSSPCQMLIKGKVVAKSKVTELTSPSHKIDAKLDVAHPTYPGMHGAIIGLSGITTDMDMDFIVLIKLAEPHEPRVMVEENDNSIAAMLTLVPSFKLAEEKVETIFLIDRSGSMMGEKVEMAKNALKLFLKSLPSDCYFNVVGFGSTFAGLFNKGSLKYDGESLAQAMNYASTLDANMGGTEIVQPLQFIYAMKKLDGYKRQVIVLTDGEVGNVDEVMNLVKANNKESRTFALGIGSDVSQGLVRGIARMGRGTSLFCSLDERLETKVQQQLANCLQPALQDVEIQWGTLSTFGKKAAESPENVEKTRTLLGFGKPKKPDSPSPSEQSKAGDQSSGVLMAPFHIPPIFDGSRFTQFCMFPKELLPAEGKDGLDKVLGPVKITAKAPDGPLNVSLEIKPADVFQGKTIHRLAVKTRIQDLEEGVSELHEKQDNSSYETMEAHVKAVKDSLVVISTKYNIVCKETAFIAVDSEAKKEEKEITMKKRQVPNQMPHGYGGGGFFAQRMPMGCAPMAMACNAVGFGGSSIMSFGQSAPMPAMMARSAAPRMKRMAAGFDSVAPQAEFEAGTAMPEAAQFRCGTVCADSVEADNDLYMDASDDANEGAAPEIEVKEEAKELDEEEKLRRLVDLQEFDGTFALTDGLAKLLGTDKDGLEKAGKELKLDTHLPLWATALAIALMEIVLADLQDDWQLMCNKAKQALTNQLAKETGLGLDSNAILAAANKHVKSLGAGN